MTRAEAFELLDSNFSAERLRGARCLAALDLNSNERSELVDRLEFERDAWVQQALRKAIAGRQEPPSGHDDVILDLRTISEVHAQATEHVTRLILHEIRPILGYLETWVAREVPDFSNSHSQKGLGRLTQLLDTFAALNEASAAPSITEFDLTTLVGEWSLEQMERDARIVFARSDSVVVKGDPRLVGLAVSNCLRNAVEATNGGARPDSPVVMNWGATDRDYWIAILDEGVGLPQAFDRVHEAGVTTKNDDGLHFGIGLTIAHRALHSLSGSVEVRPREDAGTVAEIRWPLQTL